MLRICHQTAAAWSVSLLLMNRFLQNSHLYLADLYLETAPPYIVSMMQGNNQKWMKKTSFTYYEYLLMFRTLSISVLQGFFPSFVDQESENKKWKRNKNCKLVLEKMWACFIAAYCLTLFGQLIVYKLVIIKKIPINAFISSYFVGSAKALVEINGCFSCLLQC